MSHFAQISPSCGSWRFALVKALVAIVILNAAPSTRTSGQVKTTESVADSRSKPIGLGDAKPSRQSAAKWRIDGFNRVVHIHQADGTDAGARALYFYRPLLALEENPNPLIGFPPIVLKAKPLNDKMTKLTFAARLALPEFESVAKFQIGQQDTESLRIQSLRAEQVKVEPWPITHAVIDCKLEGEGEPLASGQTESLASTDEQIPFTLTFTSDALEKFKKGYEEKELLFAFWYTFEGRRVAEGSVAVNAAKDIRAIVDQSVRTHLTPAQQNGTSPIFLHQITDVERDIRMRLQRVIRAQHKDLFPVLTDSSVSAVGKLFELNKEYTIEELHGNKALNDAVAQYFRPLVEKWGDFDARTTKIGGEDEKKRSESKTNRFNFGIAIPVSAAELKGGADSESSVAAARRNLLKTDYGVETKKDSDGQYYVPYSIKSFRYNLGTQNTSIDDVHFALLGIGEADHYLTDTPVPGHYTVSKLRELTSKVGVMPRTVADTVEEALTNASKELAVARDRLATVKKAHTQAAGELTAAESALSAARNELTTASANLAELRKQTAEQEAIVCSMPREVPATQQPFLARLLGVVYRGPTISNPDLPAAEQNLTASKAALDQAVTAEAAAKVRVEQGPATVAATRSACDIAQRQVESAQSRVIHLEAKVAALNDLLKSPPQP